MSALLDDVFLPKVEDKHFSILDNTCQQWSWYLPVPSLVNKSWHGHGFSRHRHRRNDEHPKKAIAQVYPSTGWWFGWKSHTNLSQHGSIWGVRGWPVTGLRFVPWFFYIKHSCFIVPNYNSKFSRCCWGDFSRSSSTLQCFFLNVIGDTVLTFIDEFEKTKAVQQQAFKAVIWRLDVTQLQKVYEKIFQGDSIGDHIFHGNDL